MIVFPFFLQRFLRHTPAEELSCRDDLFDLRAWLGMDPVTAGLLVGLILLWAHGNLLVWEGSGTVARIGRERFVSSSELSRSPSRSPNIYPSEVFILWDTVPQICNCRSSWLAPARHTIQKMFCAGHMVT